MITVSLVSSTTQMALVVTREVSCSACRQIMENHNHAMTGVITPEKHIENIRYPHVKRNWIKARNAIRSRGVNYGVWNEAGFLKAHRLTA